ncbi:hypothetical protein [Anaerobium acetethylicum]|uniref:hypothetical protein n=1 Tax=Anaerobium acetethylicum TaxID=1619234 RepID=UPI001471AFBA|nr:hypothetical protein [Anaerobium acetethylicum]
MTGFFVEIYGWKGFLNRLKSKNKKYAEYYGFHMVEMPKRQGIKKEKTRLLKFDK